jgi:putative ABC transport system permease protein
MARFLNFDITSFAVPLWVYLLVAAVGLIIPLIAAAIPVWIGSGVTIREALADFGAAGGVFGRGVFDGALLALKGPARPVLLAVRNSFRRRLRLTLTILTLACAGVFFMSALNVRASLIHTLDRLFGGRKFDLSVTLGAMAPRDAVDRAVGKTPGIARAEGWMTTEGSIPGEGGDGTPHQGRHGRAGGTDRFTVIALPAGTDLLEMNLIDGRGLRADDTNVVVLNTAMAAKARGVKAGGEVALSMAHRSMPWKVVGITREPFSPPIAYVSLSYLESLGIAVGSTNSLRLVLDRNDTASIQRVEIALDRNLEAEGIRAVGSMSQSEARFGFDQHMLMIYVFLVIMSFIIGGVGGLGLMTTMSLNVLERRREMGILRAIGATPRAIGSIVVIESVAIAAISSILAALVAWPVSKSAGNLMVRMMFRTNLDFSFQFLGFLIWLAISIALGALASFLPARHASRGSVREALGYE